MGKGSYTSILFHRFFLLHHTINQLADGFLTKGTDKAMDYVTEL